MLDLFILAALYLLIICALACTVLFVRLAWLGIRFWLLCGSLASCHRVIDAQIALDEQTDELMRAGMHEADKRGWLEPYAKRRARFNDEESL